MKFLLKTKSESESILRLIAISFFIYLLFISVYASFHFVNLYLFHKEIVLSMIGFGIGYRAVFAPFFSVVIAPELIGSSFFLVSLAAHVFCFAVIYLFVRIVNAYGLFARYKKYFLALVSFLFLFSVSSGIFEFLQLQKRISSENVQSRDINQKYRSGDAGADAIQQRFVYRGFQESGKPTGIFVGDFYGKNKQIIKEIPSEFSLGLISPSAQYFINENHIMQQASVVKTDDLSEVLNLCEKIHYVTSSGSNYNTTACFVHNCAWSSDERFLSCFGNYKESLGKDVSRANGSQYPGYKYYSVLRVFDMFSGKKVDVFTQTATNENIESGSDTYTKEGRIFWSEDGFALRFLWDKDLFEILNMSRLLTENGIIGDAIKVPYFQKVNDNALVVNDRSYYKADSTSVPSGIVVAIADPVEKYKTQDLIYFVVERGFKKDDQYRIVNKEPLPSFDSIEGLDAKHIFLRGDQNMILNIENGSVFILDHYKEDERKYLFVRQVGEKGGMYFYLNPVAYNSSKE